MSEKYIHEDIHNRVVEKLERELREAKELLQEFYDDSPVQNRDFDIWERTEKLLGIESEAV